MVSHVKSFAIFESSMSTFPLPHILFQNYTPPKDPSPEDNAAAATSDIDAGNFAGKFGQKKRA